MRITFCLLGLSTAFLLASATLSGQQPNPLADLKSAAEAGDAKSQDKLGDIYRNSGDFENAVTWYRRAAPQGMLNSQYQLAHQLLSWADSPMVKKEVSVSHVDEALPWLLKAATRRHVRAQLELGRMYGDGRFLAKDLPEAYKWFCLAAEGAPMDIINTGKSSRDSLILKMTQEQISEGNKRVAQFLADPERHAAILEPSYFQHVKLQGIGGAPGHPLAIINGKTLAPNDSATIKLDGRSVKLQCLTVTPKSTTILIDDFPTPKKLLLQ